MECVLDWLRLGLGRDEAGGEDRNVCSIWNRSHGTRKLSGKHPLDGETFLNKNKEQRTKECVLDVPFLADVPLYNEHGIDVSSSDGAAVPDSYLEFYQAVPSGGFHLTNCSA